MKNKESLKYICLFGGGAIRGAAHVGAIKAFEEYNISCDTYGGSSVGSMIAVLRAIGYSVDEIAEVFLGVNFELFRDISFGFNTKFALSKGEVFLDWIRELIEKKFYGKKYKKGKNKPVKFKDIDKNIIIISTNIKDFTCHEFSTFKTPDFEVAMAVRISCCAPGLMKPVSIEDKLLVDGDLMKSMPMWSLCDSLKNSKERIMEIRLEGEYTGDDNTPMDYVNGMYSCMTSCGTEFIKSIYNDNDMFDYIVLNTGNVIVFDFNYPLDKRQDIIDAGYNQAVEYLKNVLPLKKQKMYSIYLKILDKIRRVQEFILRKKYLIAKNNLAELFILLTELKDKIDNNIFSEIVKFQKILFSNVKVGLLGASKCENLDLVKAQQLLLINLLTDKVRELENYFQD